VVSLEDCYLVCLAHLVYPASLAQPKKQNKLNKPDDPNKPG
jgi:hypothetical protein